MAVVLVVDDAETDRDLIGRVVTAAGHRVVFAIDGREAISMAKMHKPSLILLDVLMPVLDGFATCRSLTKDPETSQIPVVIVSSKATDSDLFWGRKQGAQDYVTKPWTTGQLEAVMKRFCR